MTGQPGGLAALSQLLGSAGATDAADADAAVRIETATVTSVSVGGAEDAHPLVTVTWRGVPVRAPHVVGFPYVPGSLGLTVAVLVRGASLLILGPVGGIPPLVDVPDAQTDDDFPSTL